MTTTIDIRTMLAHDNSGYLPSSDADLVIIFDYVDDPSDRPSYMQAFLYPHGRSEPTYCESGHDVPAGSPIIDIPDRTFCFMCPDHFVAGSVN